MQLPHCFSECLDLLLCFPSILMKAVQLLLPISVAICYTLRGRVSVALPRLSRFLSRRAVSTPPSLAFRSRSCVHQDQNRSALSTFSSRNLDIEKALEFRLGGCSPGRVGSRGGQKVV